MSDQANKSTDNTLIILFLNNRKNINRKLAKSSLYIAPYILVEKIKSSNQKIFSYMMCFIFFIKTMI